MPRKPNGEGTLTQLNSGSWRYRDWVEVNGVRQRLSFTGATPTAAKKAYKQYCSTTAHVTIERVSTFKQWSDHWLEIYKKPNSSWKVHYDYKMYLDHHICPAVVSQKKAGSLVVDKTFGDLKLQDIRPAHVAKLFAGLKGRGGSPLSRSAQEKVRIVLNGVFETAIDNHLCTLNPAKKISLPEKLPTKITVFSKTQMAAILEYMPQHEYGPYVAILLFSGLRKGELITLMHTDIDTENMVFNVRRSLTRDENGEKVGTHTKTKYDRIVPYDNDLVPYLDKLPKDSLYLISQKDGSHHSYFSFDRCYYKFFGDLNAHLETEEKDPVPILSPHKCRHTFATYSLRSGANLRQVQRLLGHQSVSTTEIYTGVDIEDLRAGITKIYK